MRGPAVPPRVLHLDARDNVAVAVADLEIDEVVDVEEMVVTVRDAIPFGHKMALTSIDEGASIVKYGEVVGIATCVISSGDHVHVHNVASSRLPGEPAHS